MREDNYEINSIEVKFSENNSVKNLELIGDIYAILTYDIKIKEILVIDLITNEIVGKIGDVQDLNINRQYICYVYHASMIFCCQKNNDKWF